MRCASECRYTRISTQRPARRARGRGSHAYHTGTGAQGRYSAELGREAREGRHGKGGEEQGDKGREGGEVRAREGRAGKDPCPFA